MSKAQIEWNVEGMDCVNCATSITRFLERKGLKEVYVNYATGEVRFQPGDQAVDMDLLKKGIAKLGYHVAEPEEVPVFWSLDRKLLVSAVFTAPLLLQHIVMAFGFHGVHALHNPWVQLVVCLPVFILGAWHFGVSAWGSVKNKTPNMDVLIFLGSTAAFIYSLVGAILNEPDYLFFETTATIITLVFTGNWLEKRSVKQTTTAIGELSNLQAPTARKIMPSGAVVNISTNEIEVGDLLQVNEGDQIPTDGTIEEGDALLDESMLTGESEPVNKQAGEVVIGASVIVHGTLQMRATAVGRQTVLSRMIELVKTAQQDKPSIQRLADRISAIFVPAVVSIALLTFLVSFFAFDISFQKALMNSIAVLVISCPCAMGLATPTAVMVGVGRLARNGILVKGGQTVETFASIRQFIFDKTGTLTTGKFEVGAVDYLGHDQGEIRKAISGMELHSSHPIAHSLLAYFPGNGNGTPFFKSVQEQKGQGIKATDQKGHTWQIGSHRIIQENSANGTHSLYLTRDDQLMATIDLRDALKFDAKQTIGHLKELGLETVILSGDRQAKTQQIAQDLGIDHFYAEQLPEQKLEVVEKLSANMPTAMIGDGINDAPALAKATLGVSLSNASQAAIQSAQIILLNGQLHRLIDAVSISRATLQTIKQNLFWAFAYNVVAIPIAAMGFLNPMWGALFMAFSDIVVIGNSIRLKYRKV
ncbi:MAG: cadmium-translocating P-type ATPase [Saprospirales bacterium]|nr:cadmium-translocating P-type ATPase [Saprospirales bacterium]